MGWWAIGDEGGGIDWGNLGKGGMANHWPGEDKQEQMMMGDGPADMMGDVMDILTKTRDLNKVKQVMAETLEKVVSEYEESWERKPFKQELIACFNFCQIPKTFKYIWDELIKDYK